MSRRYQVCTRCIMDTSAPSITFDESGICSYCTEFLSRAGAVIHADPDKKMIQLDRLISEIKAQGKGKPYDCVIGVSGGVDSSWVVVQAVKLGLRPLAAHMDNGWNSELAQSNIANLVQGLGVDLYTHVIDWEEYRRLMQAFFDADVLDVELLYDNAMLAVNYRLAAKLGIRYILTGSNLATEGMRIPKEWNWCKYDKKNIKALAKRFGNVRLKTFPAMGTLDFVWYAFVRRIKWTSVLDLMEYNKFEVMAELERSYGYKPYPYKHYESVFTRFYQGHILPEKFGVDKRRVHLGTLVASGQLSREAAIDGVAGIPYPSARALEEDRQYFMKKMGWSVQQLDSYLARPERLHSEFGSERSLWDALEGIYRATRKW